MALVFARRLLTACLLLLAVIAVVVAIASPTDSRAATEARATLDQTIYFVRELRQPTVDKLKRDGIHTIMPDALSIDGSPRSVALVDSRPTTMCAGAGGEIACVRQNGGRFSYGRGATVLEATAPMMVDWGSAGRVR